jgi:dTDP-4-amino-4,6-dideoxygalactose transaminase
MIPLTRPELRDSDTEAMLAAVRAGAISAGEGTVRFAEALAGAVGARGGVATPSATTALVLALRALGVAAGDEVILPSYTCVAVLHAVVQSGATPVLADSECDPERMDYNLGARHVAAAATRRTRAVIVPHMFGTAADVEAIRDLGIPIVEDIALSLGAETASGRPVGSVGELAVCSFHASKMLACGEGGMLLCGSEDLLRRARDLNGWADEQVEQRFGAVPRPYELRYNFRLSDVHAACGLSQLARLPATIERRRALARRYAGELRGLPGVLLPDVALPGRVYFRFMVFLRDRDPVEVLRAFAARGIEGGRGVYPALHQFLRCSDDAFPETATALRGALSIPLYPGLQEDEIDRILAASGEVLGGRGR